MNSNKTLAKNTLFMYIRMLLIMVVTLFTSRIILSELGIEDFGLYSLINGVILSFTFVNNALTSTAQRYFAFTIGSKNKTDYNEVYSGCTTLFITSGALLTLVLIPLGLGLINNKFVIPIERLEATNWLFLTVCITFFVSFVRISYQSAIIAHEKMNFFAYVGILEALIKLLIVYSLAITPFDKLVTYGVLQLFTTLFFTVVYYAYVKRYLQTSFHFVFKKDLLKELSSFSGWSLYDGMASIGKVEFVNFIINGFYGVVVNAAVGIAKQLNSAINSFTSNFQTAFRPQITKSVASGDNERLVFLIYNTSKFSGVIFSMVAIPLCVNMKTILNVWLGNVPEYADVFAIFFIVSSGLEALGGALWITSHAIGNIKYFQIITGTLRLFPIPLVYLYVKYNGMVEYAFLPLVLSDLLLYLYRVNYVRKKIQINISGYLLQIGLVLFIDLLVLVAVLFIYRITHNEIVSLMITTASSIALMTVLSYWLLLNNYQRSAISTFIKQKFANCH